MKITYVANVRMPTEKAHGVQIVEMCNAFTDAGAEVELIVPYRRNTITKDLFDFYDVPRSFKVTTLQTPDLIRFGWLGFVVSAVIFSFFASWRVRKDSALIYSRDEFFLSLVRVLHLSYVYEVHAAKWHYFARSAIKGAMHLVMITNGLKNYYKGKGVPEERILVAPDGVNLKRFSVSLTKKECRERLGLPLGKKIALYSGHLYARKGAHVFAEAAKLLPEDILCVFVGGTEVDITAFKELYGGVKNIWILGHRPYQDIPYYLHAADVLVLPNSAKDPDSRLYTSPMKLFEYMASGTPIIASDVPSLREVLNDQNAILVHPDDSQSLLKALVSENGGVFGENAKREAERFSWKNRARSILREANEIS